MPTRSFANSLLDRYASSKRLKARAKDILTTEAALHGVHGGKAGGKSKEVYGVKRYGCPVFFVLVVKAEKGGLRPARTLRFEVVRRLTARALLYIQEIKI